MFFLQSEPCFDDSTAHLENSQVKSERCEDDENSGLEILGPMVRPQVGFRSQS